MREKADLVVGTGVEKPARSLVAASGTTNEGWGTAKGSDQQQMQQHQESQRLVKRGDRKLREVWKRSGKKKEGSQQFNQAHDA